MIPLYILGLLMRFGPQHGYQIKKLVEEQLADFTQIKLPTIYYHLEKMAAAGYLRAESGKEGARPEKLVYAVSPEGEAHFGVLLRKTLKTGYRPSFEMDGAFYFAEYLGGEELLAGLQAHIASNEKSLRAIETHRRETLPHIPEGMRALAGIIFHHHAAHYEAELAWARQAVKTIQEETHHG